MPRNARKKSAINMYHIVIRGADRQLYFEEPNDYQKYLNLLAVYKEECKFELLAYCLMDNHVHLLIYTPYASLETIFRKMNTTYSIWFNMKYDRTGFLQQGRYYSEPVEDFQYLFAVVRYIHQNPYHAGLENAPGESYPWSSIHAYQKEDSELVNTAFILRLMGGKENFFEFHKKAASENCLDIKNIRKRLPDDVAKEIINQESHCSTVADFQKLSLVERNHYIPILHEKGISIRQLNRLTGVPRGVIERILAKNHSL